MDFLAFLKNAAKSNSSVKTKFLQQYSNNDNALHVFYEGNDDPSFYSNYFEHKSNLKIYYYQAENKKGVYEIYTKINWTTYSKNRTLFFVDKDFSDILNEVYPNDNNIFVTKYYSIENYLVCKSIFTRIFRDILHIDDDKYINGCYKDFDLKLEEFDTKILSLIAWILYHRSINSKLNLNNFKISDVFSFDEKLNISRNKTFKGKKILTYLLQRTGVTNSKECWKEILSYYRIIQNIKPHKNYLRGKYEIWFMITYINKLVSIINANRKSEQPKIKMQFSLNAENAVELLGPRLKKPADINKFLKKIKR